MNRSRAEIGAHLMKAARGARLPLAMAEDLYAAAPFLTIEDIAWITDDIEAGGTGLTDLTLALDSAEYGGRPAPDFRPAIAFAAARAWRPDGSAKQATQLKPLDGSIDVAVSLWDRLDAFAVRTYVPESAASRARGAGAGKIDND